MRNRRFAIVLAPLIVAALLALAGVSLGIDAGPGDVYVLTDKKAANTRATLDVQGSTFGVVVAATCAAFSESSNSPEVGSLLEVASDHPDRVGLGKKRGGVTQSRNDNPPSIRLVTGSGTGQVTNLFVCQRAQVDAEVKTKKTPARGSFEASGKDCVCTPSGSDDCALAVEQANVLLTDCQGNSSLKLSFGDNQIRRFKIRGRGQAFPASEVP